jgi:hypothetical protein
MDFKYIVLSEKLVSTFHTISRDESQSMKRAPMVDSTISARSLGTRMCPFECIGYSSIALVNASICIKLPKKKMLVQIVV